MSAGKYDFTIEQGSRFQRVFTVRDDADALVNLTGYTAELKVRVNVVDAATLLAIASTGGSPAIVLGGAAGTITIDVSAVVTAALTWSGLAYYDLELDPGTAANRFRLLEGRVALSLEVTR